MKCPKCGYDNKDGSVHCDMCKEVLAKPLEYSNPKKEQDEQASKIVLTNRQRRQLNWIKIILLVLAVTPFLRGCDQNSVSVGLGFPFSFYDFAISRVKYIFSPIILLRIALVLVNLIVAFILFNVLKPLYERNIKNGIYINRALTINICLFWTILLSNVKGIYYYTMWYLIIPPFFVLLKIMKTMGNYGSGQNDFEITYKIWFIVSTALWFGLFKFKDFVFEEKPIKQASYNREKEDVSVREQNVSLIPVTNVTTRRIRVNKPVIIISAILVFNYVMVLLGLSPLGLKYFFPEYTDRILYDNAAWVGGDKIVLKKRIINEKVKTESIFTPYNETLSDKTYICLIDKDGNNKKELIELPYRSSPDDIISNNEMILFSDRLGQVEQIFKLNMDGTGYTVLCNGAYPTFSPDGKIIAYEDQGIWVSSIDGKNKKKITTFGSGPIWSPNGKEIVFWKWLDSDIHEIWIYNFDSNSIKQLNLGSNLYRLIDYVDNDNIAVQATSNHSILDTDGFIFNLRTQVLTRVPIVGKYSKDGKYILTDEVKVYEKGGKPLYYLNSWKDINYGTKNRPRDNIWE
jgi:hypothetical protein